MASEYPIRGSKIGYLQQSKVSNHWTAPQSASAAFKTINANADSIKFSSGSMADEFNFNSISSLMSDEERRYAVTNANLPTMSYSLVLPKTLTAAHLIAAFQKVTEGGATAYTKSISPANTFIDFANNGGYLWTLAYSPSGNALQDGVLLTNAMINSLEMSVDNLANGVKQLVSANVSWVGNSMSFKQNLSGTWVAPPTNTATFFNTTAAPFDLTLTVGSEFSAAVVFRRLTMKLNNNVSIYSRTAAGIQQYAIKPELTFSIDIPFNTSTKGILNSFGAGDNVSFVMSNGGDGTTNGQICVTALKGVLTADPYQIESEYSALRLEVRLDRPTAGYAASFIAFSDGVSGGY